MSAETIFMNRRNEMLFSVSNPFFTSIAFGARTLAGNS